MKNADMKVIAIILSIALFFTIVTSNIVSIASIAVLLTGGSGTAAAAEETAKPGQSDKEVDDSGLVAGEDSMEQEQDISGITTDEDGNFVDESGNVLEQNPIEIAPLKSYQMAIDKIVKDGAAGYDKKAWQSIEGNGLELAAESSLVNALLGALKGTLTDLIMGFMTSEADASVATSDKGSPEAMDRMPASNCTEAYVQKAEAVKDGDNYKITIVMRTQQNPKKADTDGLRVMSKDILYMEDVEDTIKNDSTVSAVVKELKVGTIDYVDYTITAVMTPDMQFVSIDHDCIADLNATIDAVGVGVVYGSGNLGFHTRYTNFVY